MQQEMVVLEGKVFTIDLQSMLGSTAYGWCLSGLPEGIILESIEIIRDSSGISPVTQRFYFGVSSAKNPQAELSFVLACVFQPEEIAKEEKISLTIIPHNSNEYITYNEQIRQKEAENVANCIIPYGVNMSREAAQTQMVYGINSCALYAYPPDAALKYGYPCSVQDAALKYGYPCSVQDAALKYGYPYSAQNAALKYGYPFC